MRLPQEEERQVCLADGQEILASGEGRSGYSTRTSDQATPPRDAGASMTRTFQRVLCPSTEM